MKDILAKLTLLENASVTELKSGDKYGDAAGGMQTDSMVMYESGCEICGRGSCTRSFHSLADQEEFDTKTGRYAPEEDNDEPDGKAMTPYAIQLSQLLMPETQKEAIKYLNKLRNNYGPEKALQAYRMAKKMSKTNEEFSTFDAPDDRGTVDNGSFSGDDFAAHGESKENNMREDEANLNEAPKGSTEPLWIGAEVKSRNPNNGTYGMRMTVKRIEDDKIYCGGKNLQTMPYSRKQLELINLPQQKPPTEFDESTLNEKSKSKKQAKFMAACAHGADYSSCPPKNVSKEFNRADQKAGTLKNESTSCPTCKGKGKIYQIYVMHNYYDGKYYDYGGRAYPILASSPEEALVIARKYKDEIEEDLRSKFVRSGNRRVRLISKNDNYHLKDNSFHSPKYPSMWKNGNNHVINSNGEFVSFSPNDEVDESKINEVSKNTLGNYIKKASNSRASYGHDWDNGRLAEPGSGRTRSDVVRKNKNRKVGINTAVDKITKTVDESKKNNMRKLKESIETNDPGLDKILRHFGKEVRDFQNGGDLADDLYSALYDYYFDEMPYGTKKARNGDPFVWISDRLDKELRGVITGHPADEADYNGMNEKEYGNFDVLASMPSSEEMNEGPAGDFGGDSGSGNDISPLSQSALDEDDEYQDSDEDEDEVSDLYSGCYVEDTANPGEVFKMSGDPYDRRVRIEDKNGGGWYISSHRLKLVTDFRRINRWFPDETKRGRREWDDSLDEAPVDMAAVRSRIAQRQSINARIAAGENPGYEDPYQNSIAQPNTFMKKPIPSNNPRADIRQGEDEFRMGVSEDEMIDEEFLVENNEDLISDILEEHGLDHGLDFFFDNGLVAIGKSTARVIINALKEDPRITATPSFGRIDGEEVQIAFNKEASSEVSYAEIKDLAQEPEHDEFAESVVNEEVSLSLSATGEEDALNIIRKLSGLATVDAEPEVGELETITDIEPESEEGPEEEVGEAEEGEYVNAPDPTVHTSTTDMINRGNDLNRPKRQDFTIRNLGNNPMAETRNLFKQYEAMKAPIKK